MIAEDGGKGDAEAVEKVAKVAKRAAVIVKRAVDKIPRDDDKIGARLRHQGADVVAALAVEILGIPCRDLVGAQALWCLALCRIDDLHIGQLQDADAFPVLGKAQNEITPRKRGALYLLFL